MKKYLLTLLVATAMSFASGKVFAQYEKGDKLLNLGLDLGGTYGGGGIGAGASYEQGIHDFISVGAQLDYVNWNYGGVVGYKWKYNFWTIAARGSYHFGKHFLKIDKLDLYGGPALGYRITNVKAPDAYTGYYDGNYNNGVFFGVFAGAKYYFKPTMAAFAEVGYNAAPLKVGIAFKF